MSQPEQPLERTNANGIGSIDEHAAAIAQDKAIAERQRALCVTRPDLVCHCGDHTCVEDSRLRTFLASIATADPQTDQAKWMVSVAREALGWD